MTMLEAESVVLRTRARDLELPAPSRAWIARSSQPEVLADEGERLMVARAEAVVRELRLTPREGEVLLELMRLDSYDEIADELGIARSTVRTHAKKVFEKTGTHSRHALTLFVAFGIRLTRTSRVDEGREANAARVRARAETGRTSGCNARRAARGPARSRR